MSADDLARKKCVPCEGGVPKLAPERVQQLLGQVPGWELTRDGRRIVRRWRVADFQTGLDFFGRVGRLAEDEGHHPDLHLANYRDVTIELWTHAAGGLTDNDFILAAKINGLEQPKLKA
jgi:4a-hydroxytetrahydrobiopterin dehydratase